MKYYMLSDITENIISYSIYIIYGNKNIIHTVFAIKVGWYGDLNMIFGTPTTL